MKKAVSARKLVRAIGVGIIFPVGTALLVHTCSSDSAQPKEAGAPAESERTPASLASQLIPVVNFAQFQFGDSVIPPLVPFLGQLDSLSVLLPAASPLITPAAKLDHLKRLVYEDWAIAFDRDQHRIGSMFPHTTVSSKRGSCLGVSLLFLLLGEKLGLSMHGVVLPGHFFFRYDDGLQRMNFEPNRQGYRYTDEQYRTKYMVSDSSWYDLRNLTTAEVIAVVKYNLANVCREAGKLEAAAELYKQAGTELPGFSEAFGNLGLTYDLLGEYEQAVGALLKAKSIRPDIENVSRNLGTLYLKMGRFAHAVREYEDGLVSRPDDAELLYGRGLALYRAGDMKRAGEGLRAALRAKPGYPEARKLLNEIERSDSNRG